MRGSGSPGPLEAMEGLVFLCHAPCVTLLGERLAKPCPRGSAREPPSLSALGRVFLCPSLGWCLRPGESQGSSLSLRRLGA
jgi:hypothetical protein